RVQAQKQMLIKRVVTHQLSLLRTETGEIVAPPDTIHAHRLRTRPELHRAADVGGLWRIVVPAHRIGYSAEHRMQNGTVQAFVVIRNSQLPVCLYLVNALLVQAQILKPPRRKLLRQVAQLLGARLSTRGQVQKNGSVPNAQMNSM